MLFRFKSGKSKKTAMPNIELGLETLNILTVPSVSETAADKLAGFDAHSVLMETPLADEPAGKNTLFGIDCGA